MHINSRQKNKVKGRCFLATHIGCPADLRRPVIPKRDLRITKQQHSSPPVTSEGRRKLKWRSSLRGIDATGESINLQKAHLLPYWPKQQNCLGVVLLSEHKLTAFPSKYGGRGKNQRRTLTLPYETLQCILKSNTLGQNVLPDL